MKTVVYRGAKPGVPLRSKQEMAEEFGISMQSLAGLMRTHAGAPKPCITHGTPSTKTKIEHYDPREMRAWYAQVLAEIAAKPVTPSRVKRQRARKRAAAVKET